MDKTLNKVLTECISKAGKGEIDIDVFDLMYETCLPYPELKVILDKLVEDNELVQTDLKTYRFIGDVNGRLDEEETQEPLFQNAENGPDREAAYAAGRTYMEQRRKELIEKMVQEQMEQEYDEANDEENDQIDIYDLLSEDEEEMASSNYLSDFVIDIFEEKLSPDAFIEAPLHLLWDDKSEFLQVCADHLIILMNSDKQMGRIKAIKRARLLLSDLLKARDRKTAEVYEYIVYGLSYMSNYYYNKIRESL